MSNTFITSGFVGPAMLASLHDAAVVANLVYRDAEAGFAGATGDTVPVRRPACFTANMFNRGSSVTVQNVTETGEPIQLGGIYDVSVDVTAERLTYQIPDLRAETVQPAMQAL